MGTVRKLLLADDSITIQKVVNLTFADEGFEVTAVGNGDLAVEKLEEIEPDIVLADVHMPGLNGYEVCESVKRNERFRHVPVMLLVGSFEPYDEAEARRVGADDYLTKPFQSIRQLVSKVSSLLSGRSTEDGSTSELDSNASLAESDQSQAPSPPIEQIEATPEVEVATASEPIEDAFPDPIFDDAMIEATPAGDFNMNRSFSTQRGTTPLSESDLIDAGLKIDQPETIHTQDTLRMNPREIWGDRSATPTDVVTQSPQAKKRVSPEDALLDLGDDEPIMAERGEDEFILDIWDDPPKNASSIPVELVEREVVRYEGEVTADAMPAAQFNGEEVGYAAPYVESRADSVQRTDQLSPETIDAIARRAVEHLSERVIEQIAWEVVPELAERLIKRRLEEERTK